MNCQLNNLDPVKSIIAELLGFPSFLGQSYGTINSPESAFSHIILIPPNQKLSDHPLMAQYGQDSVNF